MNIKCSCTCITSSTLYVICLLICFYFTYDSAIGGGGGRVKRQVWTDTSIEAFAEGLCQVHVHIRLHVHTYMYIPHMICIMSISHSTVVLCI